LPKPGVSGFGIEGDMLYCIENRNLDHLYKSSSSTKFIACSFFNQSTYISLKVGVFYIWDKKTKKFLPSAGLRIGRLDRFYLSINLLSNLRELFSLKSTFIFKDKNSNLSFGTLYFISDDFLPFIGSNFRVYKDFYLSVQLYQSFKTDLSGFSIGFGLF